MLGQEVRNSCWHKPVCVPSSPPDVIFEFNAPPGPAKADCLISKPRIREAHGKPAYLVSALLRVHIPVCSPLLHQRVQRTCVAIFPCIWPALVHWAAPGTSHICLHLCQLKTLWQLQRPPQSRCLMEVAQTQQSGAEKHSTEPETP